MNFKWRDGVSFKTSKLNVLGTVLEEKARLNDDKTFFIFEGVQVSYADVHERSNRVANGLRDLGVTAGSKVVLLTDNCPEFIYTWFALAKLGAVEVPINPSHKGDILEYLINYSDADILIISSRVIDELKKIESRLQTASKVVVVGQQKKCDFSKLQFLSYDELLNYSDLFSGPEVCYSDQMAIIFTSGTTGSSKGVIITHNQAFFVANQYKDALNVDEHDVSYLYVPLFHEAAQFGSVIMTLLCNGTFVLTRGFKANNFWRDIKTYNCSVSGIFEAVTQILIRSPRRDDDKCNPMRVFATGHVNADIQEEFEDRFGVKLVNIYGSTEGDATVTATYNDIKLGSFGKPRGYFDVRVFNEGDIELAANKTGELVLRPLQPHIMFEGYYKMPEKTLSVFRNLWWHTGDLAYRDEDGYYFYVGREKDMIRRGGENISAVEVENIVCKCPEVAECAAVAVPSEIWGEEVKIVVVKKADSDIKHADLISFCDERMAYFMVPRFIEFLDSIPRTGGSSRPIKNVLCKVTEKTWDRMKAGVKISREKKKSEV